MPALVALRHDPRLGSFFPPEIDHRAPLRVFVPYFIFLLTINLFFCLVLPTQLLKNVKSSHQVDLAYR
jgi:hypothetical protein